MTKSELRRLDWFISDLIGLFGKRRLAMSEAVIYRAIADQARQAHAELKDSSPCRAYEYLKLAEWADGLNKPPGELRLQLAVIKGAAKLDQEMACRRS